MPLLGVEQRVTSEQTWIMSICMNHISHVLGNMEKMKVKCQMGIIDAFPSRALFYAVTPWYAMP